MELHRDELDAAILTGGQSSRMGRDKALLEWDGVPLVEQALAILRGLDALSGIMIVGDRPAYAGRGAPVVADDFPGVGPLGGIATALRRSGADRVLVVAVDMPCLSPELLAEMASLRFDGQALVPRYRGLQPLHAIYRCSCLPAVERQIEAGELRIADLFEHIDVTYLDEAWIEAIDPEGCSFVNVNTPEDIARLRCTGASKRGHTE